MTSATRVVPCSVPSDQHLTPAPLVIPKQKLINKFAKHLDDHEKKFGKKIPDRALYLEAPWPTNVLQHVLTAYHQRNSFMGSLSRSRTSLNFLSAANTPNLDRRRSISPSRETKSAATSAYNTTKRGKLTKASRYASTSNLKLVSEKISGFSVFNNSDQYRREPIMAYDSNIVEEPKRPSLERTKPIDKKKMNRQSMSELLFKTEDLSPMKRSISQQSLKQDIALEAVMIDLPSLDSSRYSTIKSGSTVTTDSLSSDDQLTTRFSRWGAVRGSNSYSNSGDVPVSQLSTLNLKKTIAADKNDGPPDSVV